MALYIIIDSLRLKINDYQTRMYLVDFKDYHSGQLFVKLIILIWLLQNLISLPSCCGSYSSCGRDKKYPGSNNDSLDFPQILSTPNVYMRFYI
jgi:hypothetical protein